MSLGVHVNEANYQKDAGLATLAYLAMLVLFSRQARRSRTPSGISRVSRWTFLAQATVDSVSFAGHITFAILAEGRPSLSLTAPAFLACMLFVYEAVRLHLLMSIHLSLILVTAILCLNISDPTTGKRHEPTHVDSASSSGRHSSEKRITL